MTQSATHLITDEEATAHPPLEAMVVRFAGDSGDGMQLTGGQFTLSTALAGNDLATFPDFPAEIRAPQGTTFGVSAFQINFGSTAIDTAGDQPDVLVAMNPAALKTNVKSLRDGGLIIADEGEFGPRNLAKAGYDANPLEDDSLARWQLVKFNISQLTLDAVKPFGLGNKEALRCKNMWTLGLALWMFDRDRAPIVEWLKTKFAKAPELAEANIAALERRPCLWRDGRDWRAGAPASHRRRARPSPASTAPSPAPNRCRSGWSRGRNWPASRCSSAAIRSRRPRPSSTTSAASRNMASPPSRRRMRSPPSAPRSAPAMPASSA